MSITPNHHEVVHLSRRQVREVDRRAIEDYGIPGVVLMENAGRNAAAIIRSLFVQRERTDAPVAIVCGRGNNGGDGFVIARHLANAGIAVELYLACDPDRLRGDALTNYRVVRTMRLPMRPLNSEVDIASAAPQLKHATIIADAILGTGFSGDVRPPLDAAIRAINDCDSRVVAIDVPSGLDCDTGAPSNATVRADTTITFVAPKIGFRNASAGPYCGEVHVADIGAPIEIIETVLAM